MGGTLTFTYRNNLQATSNTTPNAGNDKYYLYNGGTLTQAGFLYTSPSPPGQTFTKTLTLSPAEIANNRVTLVVQDDTATTEIYTLSLHDALPIWAIKRMARRLRPVAPAV